MICDLGYDRWLYNLRIAQYFTGPAAMNQTYRVTTYAEKLLTSTINTVVALLFAAPFLLFELSAVQLKLILVAAFLAENLEAMLFHRYRLPGMWVIGSRWQTTYPVTKQLVHAVLYSASFSTLVFWIWFPGDLLLFNLLCLQLPCVLMTGTTLHGLLAGNMVDIKPEATRPEASR